MVHSLKCVEPFIIFSMSAGEDEKQLVQFLLILWLISLLVEGGNNCCAAILGIFFQSPILLTLQKDKQAIQY